MSITSLLRVGTLATVAMGSLLASSSTQAQSPFFSFTPKGSYFLTSVTQWSPNMPNHYAVGVAQPVVMGKTGYRQYSAPEATVRGLTGTKFLAAQAKQKPTTHQALAWPPARLQAA